MNFLKIKFFPSKAQDYLYFCFSNIIFLIILLGLIEQKLEEKNKNENSSEVMLFIPKTYSDFEEKRDLIFNQLSANSAIISVNKLENREIKKLLFDILKNTKISDDIIPEVYDVQVERSKPLDYNIINNKITKIVDGALIKNIKPHLLHLVSIKPIIIAPISAFLARSKCHIIYAFVGIYQYLSYRKY